MNQPSKRNLSQIDALSRIYRLYDDYIDNFSYACRKYCADCCTTNVTLTTLEARYIHAFLDEKQRAALSRAIYSRTQAPRFQPAMSTNCHARLCAEGKAPPEEHVPADPGTCPLLEADACTIYPVRPFACRCMLSTAVCSHTGEARIDEFTMSVNNLFLQFIEHLDPSGAFGNFIDIWRCLDSEDADCPTVANQSVTVLMIPPEHREKIHPLLNTLNHILSRVE